MKIRSIACVFALLMIVLTVRVSYGREIVEQNMKRGLMYAVQGRFSEARVVFLKLLEIYPLYGPAQETLEVIDEAVNQKIESDAAVHFFRGAAYGNDGLRNEAIGEYSKAIALHPTFTMAYNNRGFHFMSKGYLHLAISDYSKAIKITPRSAVIYLNRGVAYARLGELDQAIGEYSKAIEITPGMATAYLNRGVAYARKGQLDKAIFDYTKAIGITPSFAVAYYNRGTAYVKKDQFDEAIADFDKAMEMKSASTPTYVH